MSFKAVQAKIAAKEGISKKSAGAILANSSRKASAKAKKKNPKLKKVKGWLQATNLRVGLVIVEFLMKRLPASVSVKLVVFLEEPVSELPTV